MTNRRLEGQRAVPVGAETPGSLATLAAVLFFFVPLTLALLGPGEASAQEAGPSGSWIPWAGCWEAVSETTDAPRTVTCIRSTDTPRVAEILTVEADEAIPEPEVLRADGQRTEASREGCEGWERAEFSEDGARVYLRTEFRCEGGIQRTSSGIFSVVSPYEWLDVRTVESGGESRTWTRRYRRLDSDELERPELEAWADAEDGLAVEAARVARSGAPALDDVVEASGRVHEDAVVAWLAEEGDPVEVDGDRLLELADAGVPGAVTDMLVALGNPDQFVVGSDGAVEAEERFAGSGSYRGRRPTRVLTAWGGRGWPYYGPGFGSFGFRYDPFYRPWGYGGYGYGGYGYTYRPTVVYVQPRSSADSGGQMVRGRGYTRPGSSAGSRSGEPRASGSSGTSRAPSRGDQGGSVSRDGGYRGGSSGSTGRTARPRDDGDN